MLKGQKVGGRYNKPFLLSCDSTRSQEQTDRQHQLSAEASQISYWSGIQGCTGTYTIEVSSFPVSWCVPDAHSHTNGHDVLDAQHPIRYQERFKLLDLVIIL